MNKYDIHKAIVEELHELYINKDKDYGASFSDTRKEFGKVAVMIRLTDKYKRLKQLLNNPNERKVQDETIKDTLRDLANYCIMELVEIELDEKEQTNNNIDLTNVRCFDCIDYHKSECDCKDHSNFEPKQTGQKPALIEQQTCKQCAELRKLKYDISGKDFNHCNANGLDIRTSITAPTICESFKPKKTKELYNHEYALDPYND